MIRLSQGGGTPSLSMWSHLRVCSDSHSIHQSTPCPIVFSPTLSRSVRVCAGAGLSPRVWWACGVGVHAQELLPHLHTHRCVHRPRCQRLNLQHHPAAMRHRLDHVQVHKRRDPSSLVHRPHCAQRQVGESVCGPASTHSRVLNRIRSVNAHHPTAWYALVRVIVCLCVWLPRLYVPCVCVSATAQQGRFIVCISTL